MIKFLGITVAFLILSFSASDAVEMTFIAPNRGAPGTLVAIGGGPFSAQSRPVLGEQQIIPLQVTGNRIEFSIPYLPPGTYQLAVRDNSDSTAQSYSFEVLAPTPQLTEIVPSNLDACSSDPEIRIQITGRNFVPGAALLVNDNAVPSEVLSPNRIEAQLRPIQQPGVYGVAVRNPDGATSLPHSLWVDNLPEIISVERGGDFVNYYEVIIRGKNFQYNSTLVIKEPEGSVIGQAYR